MDVADELLKTTNEIVYACDDDLKMSKLTQTVLIISGKESDLLI